MFYTAHMATKTDILDELDEILAAVIKLKGAGQALDKQTDLEVAILKKQIAGLMRDKHNAADKVSRALDMLKAAPK